MFEFLARILPTSSVVSIVNGLAVFSQKLIEAEKRDIERASKIEGEIVALQAERDNATENAAAARKLANGIASLTN